MPYRFFVPPASDTAAPDAKFPLVLFLHGAGERGTDNWWPSADHIDGLIDATQSNQFASFLLVPQATDFPYADGWDAESPFDRTMEILDQMMTQYPIDPARIYITGLSMGGYGTFNYLQHYPDFFAAAVPMSGGGNPSQAYLYKDVPLWDFHGRLDKTVSVNQSRNMIAALKAAGGSPIYTELLNGDHGIWDPIYNDFSLHQYGLYEWMFDQVNPNVANIAVFVPEPSTVGMALFGALALGCVGHRNRRCRKSVPGKCREHC
jgi:predicted peptidase